MTTPKYIKKLAAQVIAADPFYSAYTGEDLQRWIDSAERELMAVRKALLTGRYYTGVESVSASGMSRVIKIKYIEDNSLHGVCDYVYKLAGCDKNNRITGCGMDMLFSAQYDLFRALCPHHRYQDKMPRYRDL